MYAVWLQNERDPIYPEDFGALSRAQAEEFLDRLIKALPDRIRQLKNLIDERRPGLNWQPDFTPEAFRVAAEVFAESVELVPRDPAAMEAERQRLWESQPEIMELLGDSVRDWEPTERTVSIAIDVSLYFALDLRSKESQLVWKVETGRNADWNHPVLRAPSPTRKPPFLHYGPFRTAHSAISLVAGKAPYRYEPMVMYQHWGDTIAWYKRENPS